MILIKCILNVYIRDLYKCVQKKNVCDQNKTKPKQVVRSLNPVESSKGKVYDENIIVHLDISMG